MVNNSPSRCPRSLKEALAIAESLMNDDYREILNGKSLPEAGAVLHMTLGHLLRSRMELWGDQTDDLFADIHRRMEGYIAVEGDTASSALIDALWYRYHPEVDDPSIAFDD